MIRSLLIFFFIVSVLYGKAQGNLVGPINPSGSKHDYGIGSLIFSAGNATFCGFNIAGTFKSEDKHKSNAYFSILSGTAQVVYGQFAFNPNESQAKEFKALNVGFGLSAIITGGIRLIRKNKAEERTAFRFIYYPDSSMAGRTFEIEISRKI